MTLYEIDAAIMTAIAHGTDPETGEINNLDELMSLQMERDQKIENIACLIKNLKDDVRGWKLCLMRPWMGRSLPLPAVWYPSATARPLRWTMRMPSSTGPA